MEELLQNLISSLGVIAETTLIFYNALIHAGASEKEALKLTRVFLQVSLHDGTDEENT